MRFYLLLANGNILTIFAIMHLFLMTASKKTLPYFIPSKSKFQEKDLKPNKAILFLKAILLGLLTWFCFIQVVADYNFMTEELLIWGNRFISVIFFFRAIGDFKYTGFTKNYKESDYAELDTYIFSPLCLILSMSALMVSLQI